MLKYVLYLGFFLLSACLETGGGEKKYKAIFENPPLSSISSSTACMGNVSIPKQISRCVDEKGNLAPLSRCAGQIEFAILPSAPGNKSIAIDNGSIVVSCQSGELQEAAIARGSYSVNCNVGYYPVGNSCAPVFPQFYTPPVDTSPCAGTVTVTRTLLGCKNEANEDIPMSHCERINPQINILSSAGDKVIFVPHGRKVFSCLPGESMLSALLRGSVRYECDEGPYYFKYSLDKCAAVSASYSSPIPPSMAVCDGQIELPKIVSSCFDEDGVALSVSFCASRFTPPTQVFNSPAGIKNEAIDNGALSISCNAGESRDDAIARNSYTISCVNYYSPNNASFSCEKNIPIHEPQDSSVLSVCDGTVSLRNNIIGCQKYNGDPLPIDACDINDVPFTNVASPAGESVIEEEPGALVKRIYCEAGQSNGYLTRLECDDFHNENEFLEGIHGTMGKCSEIVPVVKPYSNDLKPCDGTQEKNMLFLDSCRDADTDAILAVDPDGKCNTNTFPINPGDTVQVQSPAGIVFDDGPVINSYSFTLRKGRFCNNGQSSGFDIWVSANLDNPPAGYTAACGGTTTLFPKIIGGVKQAWCYADSSGTTPFDFTGKDVDDCAAALNSPLPDDPEEFSPTQGYFTNTMYYSPAGYVEKVPVSNWEEDTATQSSRLVDYCEFGSNIKKEIKLIANYIVPATPGCNKTLNSANYSCKFNETGAPLSPSTDPTLTSCQNYAQYSPPLLPTKTVTFPDSSPPPAPTISLSAKNIYSNRSAIFTTSHSGSDVGCSGFSHIEVNVKQSSTVLASSNVPPGFNNYLNLSQNLNEGASGITIEARAVDNNGNKSSAVSTTYNHNTCENAICMGDTLNPSNSFACIPANPSQGVYSSWCIGKAEFSINNANKAYIKWDDYPDEVTYTDAKNACENSGLFLMSNILWQVAGRHFESLPANRVIPGGNFKNGYDNFVKNPLNHSSVSLNDFVNSAGTYVYGTQRNLREWVHAEISNINITLTLQATQNSTVIQSIVDGISPSVVTSKSTKEMFLSGLTSASHFFLGKTSAYIGSSGFILRGGKHCPMNDSGDYDCSYGGYDPAANGYYSTNFITNPSEQHGFRCYKWSSQGP